MQHADAAAIKLGAAAGAASAVVPAIILGVESSTLIAACAGALCSLAYSRPETWGAALDLDDATTTRRAAQFVLRALALSGALVANAFVAAWAASTLPHVPGFTWANAAPLPALAGLLAFSSQRIVPPAMAAATRWLDARAK